MCSPWPPFARFTLTRTDTLLRAIGKRAHTLHSLVFYSSSCVFGSTAGYASISTPLLPNEPLDTYSSMIIFKISPVIPTHARWLAMLLLIGIFGLTSQVCSSLRSFSVADPARRHFWSWVFSGRQLLAAPLQFIPQCVFPSMTILQCLSHSRWSLLSYLSSSYFIRHLLRCRSLEQP